MLAKTALRAYVCLRYGKAHLLTEIYDEQVLAVLVTGLLVQACFPDHSPD